jgi:aminopeptidase
MADLQHVRHALAVKHLRDVVALAMDHNERHRALIVYDPATEMSQILQRAYAAALPGAQSVSFYESAPETVKATFRSLETGDLVVLIQSEGFQLPEYRIRVELYNLGLKVAAHGNLSKITGSAIDYYIDSLAYDPAYYRTVGHALKAKIDGAQSASIESEGARLYFDSAFEEAKINIGDFSALKNVGSQFPIGEVFTEAVNLENVNGTVRLYAFADLSFRVNVPSAPITLHVENGFVRDVESTTPEFDVVRKAIETDEGAIMIRELGFGMNPAFSRERWVLDVGAFERVSGTHLSLGAKHGVYKKPHIKRKDGRHHIDVFPITDRALIDNQVVYEAGKYTIA